MKCRRSKGSPGARLRGSPANTTASRRTPAATAAVKSAMDAAKMAPSDVSDAAADATAAVLRIDGPAKGAIDYAGTVLVGPDGAVTGNVCAMVIVVEGQVEGDLQATQALRIGAGARVVGDLCAPRVAVTRGAKLQGRISTRHPASSAGRELDDQAVALLLAGG